VVVGVGNSRVGRKHACEILDLLRTELSDLQVVERDVLLASGYDIERLLQLVSGESVLRHRDHVIDELGESDVLAALRHLGEDVLEHLITLVVFEADIDEAKTGEQRLELELGQLARRVGVELVEALLELRQLLGRDSVAGQGGDLVGNEGNLLVECRRELLVLKVEIVVAKVGELVLLDVGRDASLLGRLDRRQFYLVGGELLL